MKTFSPFEVAEAVSNYYGVPIEEIFDKENRSTKITQLRHMTHYLSRKLTYKSMTQIGDEFGMDHSSISYGVKKMESSINNPDIASQVAAIIKSLG